MGFIVRKKHIYLNLFLINFPITAMTSIIHRVTGVMLFLFFFIVLYLFKLSIESESSFLMISLLLQKFYIKLFLFLFLSSLLYHFLFGIKHMIMDLGFFETKSASTKISLLCLFFVVVLSVIILLSMVL